MPELPEVETTRRGIEPHVIGQVVQGFVVRERRLRWPVPAGLDKTLPGQTVRSLERRAKYMIMQLDSGCLIMHLGMSGSLRILGSAAPVRRHDHYDIEFGGDRVLRYNDPRRFGSLHYTADPYKHPLLKQLGPEPLGPDFDGEHLWRLSRGRKTAVKTFIMNAAVVVGVGNIYASEALFRAGIHPARAAGRVSLSRYERLADAIREVLESAIAQGGTTLRDFVSSDGQPGYFRQSLAVYDRGGEPCRDSGHAIRRTIIGQRATYYCPACQR